MNKLIGVKNLLFSSLQKSDLLLFDAIAIPDLEEIVSKSIDSNKASLEWLIDQKIIFDANQKDIDLEMVEEKHPFYDYKLMGGFLVALAALLKNQDNIGHLFAKMGLQAFADYTLRLIAIDIERKNKIRAVPLLQFLDAPATTDLKSNVPEILNNIDNIINEELKSAGMPTKKTVEFIVTLLNAMKEKPIDLDNPTEVLSRIKNIHDYANLDLRVLPSGAIERIFIAVLFKDRAQKYVENISSDLMHSGLADSQVVNVVIDSLPVPDESVSYQDIVEFKLNDKTQSYLAQLRRWITKISMKGLNPIELREELEYLLSSYEEHMRFQKIKMNVNRLETIITSPIEIAENVVKLKWGAAAKKLFELKRQNITLMEAERSAPGREVAYIIHARKEFG